MIVIVDKTNFETISLKTSFLCYFIMKSINDEKISFWAFVVHIYRQSKVCHLDPDGSSGVDVNERTVTTHSYTLL